MSQSGGRPLLCAPEQKGELEARNGVAQLDYITDLVESGQQELRESHVLRLQEIAIRDVYPCGGKYRDMTKRVAIQNSQHTLPDCALVPSLVRDAIDWVNREKEKAALERAAYAQWRFNWIHPFAGGNGRTSRAITYLIVCMNEGRMLPGVPTMPTLIYEHRDEYIRALQAVDASQEQAEALRTPECDVQPDFKVMVDFLRQMLMKQFASAIHRLASPVR